MKHELKFLCCISELFHDFSALQSLLGTPSVVEAFATKPTSVLKIQ